MLILALVLLGLNKESSADRLTEFDRDIQRRTWCILEVWDWYYCHLSITSVHIC